MKIVTFDNCDQWLLARLGKITGTRLKDIVVKKGTGEKKGYYELIAERLAVDDTEFDGYVPNETPMDRGTRLEKFAIDRFTQETKKKVDTSKVIWMRDDNESIAISPDGTISKTEAIEIKCLSSASHIEAYLTNEIPSEYEFQKLQYFIVNPDLKTLYFCFYDPRIPCKDFFIHKVERKDVQDLVELYTTYQLEKLKKIDEEVAKLTGF